MDEITSGMIATQRELVTLDRMLTELRRDRALHRPQYDATKPLPGVMPTNKGDER